MEQEKVPVEDKIISLSDSDASFIVKGGWNPSWVTARNWHAVGAALSRRLCCLGVMRPRARTLLRVVKEQITNTGVTPSMASADDGYSTQ
jgi:hypothetical protein